MNGFIKLHRSLLDWGWYKDSNTMRVFLHLLLLANWEDSTVMGITVKRGQALFGLKSLADRLGLTERQVRTALAHLKKTGELTVQATHCFSVATVVNYSKYQEVGQRDDTAGDEDGDSEPTSYRQPNDNIKEYKNIRKKYMSASEEPGGPRSHRQGKPEAEKPWYAGTGWDVPDWTRREVQ